MAPSDDLDGASAPVRVIIADDDPFARKMIKESLQRAGVVVIAEAHNGRQAVDLARHYRPDVVLMDIRMPELDGIAATRRIVKEIPGQVVVILTTADDDEIGLLGLRAGASGFLAKDVDVDVLPQALKGALGGAPNGTGGMRPVKSPLTAREWEVIDQLVEHKTTEQIADALVLSSETVRSHVKNILRKLDARSRDEAVRIAQRMRSEPG